MVKRLYVLLSQSLFETYYSVNTYNVGVRVVATWQYTFWTMETVAKITKCGKFCWRVVHCSKSRADFRVIPQNVSASKSPGGEISKNDETHLPSEISKCHFTHLPSEISGEIRGEIKKSVMLNLDPLSL